MLYDPKWEVKITPAQIFSLERFTAWLETQNPATEYVWKDVCGCAAHKYLSAMGARQASDYPRRHNSGRLASVFPSHAIYIEVCATLPHTFGGALERARAAMSR